MAFGSKWRKKAFTSPENLILAAVDYFDWCDKHPFEIIEKGMGQSTRIVAKLDKKGSPSYKDNTICLPRMRPYTMKGVCLHIGVSENYLRDLKNRLKKDDPQYQGFMEAINFIEDAVYDQQYSGSAAGLLKENIVMAYLKLKTQIETINENTNINSIPLSTEDIKVISKILDDKF